jgi:glycosyltransferase involved in cell wall biosynthesis
LFPQKIASYLAVGRPIIATDVSDCKKIVNEAKCGIVIPPANTAALANAIEEMARMPFSKRQEMGKNARAFAETRLSEKSLLVQLEKIFSELKF